jgi:hypothetical protein
VRRVAVAILVGGLVVAACGGGDETTAKKPPPSSTTTSTIPIPIAPFTGLEDPSGVSQTRSSLAVKIENTPEARPQSGLDQADIVYEEVVDGGITRFWAVFNSAAPETVGPIRSVRAMDPDIVSALHGVVAYSGGTQGNVDLIRAAPVVWVDENNAGDSFFREPSRSAPHNLYGRTELLWQRGGQPVPPTPMFPYLAEGATFVGEGMLSFHVNLDQGYDFTYQWDATAGGWKRFQRLDEPFLAAGFPVEPQVTPTNVILQFVDYGGAGEANLYGTGEAWVFSNGQLIRGSWSRAYPYSEAPTQFLDALGQPIPLTPGRTWVELMPVGVTVDLVPAPLPPPTTLPPTTPTTVKQQGKKK